MASRPAQSLFSGPIVCPSGQCARKSHQAHMADVSLEGVLFSGDVVMGWSTTVVGGEGGDMAAYFASLDRLLGTTSSLYLPGHGPPIPAPNDYVAGLLAHRRHREAAILAALSDRPLPLDALTGSIYPGLERSLVGPAQRNVAAHLDKLEAEGRAMPSDRGWSLPR